jgi:hypothetical protein
MHNDQKRDGVKKQKTKKQPHSRLGWMTPVRYAATRRSATLHFVGSAPRTAAITAHEGITEGQTPIANG